MQRTMPTLHCFKAVISTTNDLEKKLLKVIVMKDHFISSFS